MQRFILEFAEINNRTVVYTFSEENGDISLMPFKGEEEYPVDIESYSDADCDDGIRQGAAAMESGAGRG